MSDEIVIAVEGLGKRYRIRHEAERYTALRDVIAARAMSPVRALKSKFERKKVETRNGSESETSNSSFSLSTSPRRASTEEFWALRDINFEVKRGEVLGIIGRNGAGKTTLLKILSRITEPTEGRVRIKGRVASLLEVGTGFHPELTGRENIYLNGAILGMSKAEIKKKFDEIVAFAETEKFLDTPVKRYSSGMYVRLAFAVAAHLEPEILIVDEVLAVGDAEFQKKCLGKMQNVSQAGRTVFFVSHNMAAIAQLCVRCLLLTCGKLQSIGETRAIIARYLNQNTAGQAEREWTQVGRAPGNEKLRLRAVRIRNARAQQLTTIVDMNEGFFIEMEYDVFFQLPEVRVCLRLLTSNGVIAFQSNDDSNRPFEAKGRAPGKYISKCFVPAYLLNSQRYSVTVSADIPFAEHIFQEDGVLEFSVGQSELVSGRLGERFPGVVSPRLQWQVMLVGDKAAGATL